MYLGGQDNLAGPQSYASFLNDSSGDASGAVLPLGQDYPAEYQHMILAHWRGFRTPPIYHRAGLYIAYFVLMIINIFGNGLVIWIFTTSKSLRTPSNLLILNLAVFDLFMCTNMPQYLINAAVGYVVGGELGCDIYAVCGGISGMGASITNAFIAFDRYKTISNPIDGRLSYGQIIMCIMFTWLWATPFSVLPFFQIWGQYKPEGYLTTCSFDYLTNTDEIRLFVRTIFVWSYAIPMTMVLTSYYKLFTHVRSHERMLAEQAKKMNVKSLSANASNESMSVELRIAKAALIIYMLFVIAWTPYSVVALIGCFGEQQLLTPFVTMVPALACKGVSCLDPWVYATSHPKYRLELERRLPWLGIREKQYASSGSTGGQESVASVSGDTLAMSVQN
ncbi:opsin Rh5 [Drosophila grimshawi]|uniref:GH13098 n=1 Tax=Drosophila grimshawi TaxID=7222 RepID=B4JQY0_DROGR|nr:opsin Rh5 [Drosophila grimshawi]EDV99310.1 GH13098 [Drosophila grimshawi]